MSEEAAAWLVLLSLSLGRHLPELGPALGKGLVPGVLRGHLATSSASIGNTVNWIYLLRWWGSINVARTTVNRKLTGKSKSLLPPAALWFSSRVLYCQSLTNSPLAKLKCGLQSPSCQGEWQCCCQALSPCAGLCQLGEVASFSNLHTGAM